MNFSRPSFSLPSFSQHDTTRVLAATGSVVLAGLLAGGLIKYRDDLADAFNKLTGSVRRAVPTGTERLPDAPYEHWTKAELYERARQQDITGRSRMSKAELIEALRTA